MNKYFFTFFAALAFAFGSLTFTACGDSHADGEETHEHSDEGDTHDHDGADHDHATEGDGTDADAADMVYQCPMKCEGETTYDQEGECPKCGMDLEVLTMNDEAGDEHDHDDHEGHNH